MRPLILALLALASVGSGLGCAGTSPAERAALDQDFVALRRAIASDTAAGKLDDDRASDIAEATAEAARYTLETVLLQARDVGAAIVDEASERQADLVILGLPFRRRFGGDFTIGGTIPYILKNAPCAVWVIREAMPEEQA